MAKRQKNKIDRLTQSFQEGVKRLDDNSILHGLSAKSRIIREKNPRYLCGKWATVTSNGYIFINPRVSASPDEWVYILAHCLLHLGFGHFQNRSRLNLWNIACDAIISKFLENLKLGKAPLEMARQISLSSYSEEAVYRQLKLKTIPEYYNNLSVAGEGRDDMILEAEERMDYGKPINWPELFSKGLASAVKDVVQISSRSFVEKNDREIELTEHEMARKWFMSKYPLLGSLASGFKIICDSLLLARMDIRVAAVNAELKEIYVNPSARLDRESLKFVIAHELLHVGLSHHSRSAGREPFLWNVACDYVINGWLVEMEVGEIPEVGILYDPDLKGLSAEAVYERIVVDMRRFRKLSTLRGVGMGDILAGSLPNWWDLKEGMDLDAFYRKCLGQGLSYHEEQERGYLPEGLIEEIRALSQPPIPWDVELAKWFDEHFSPIEKHRTYARPSRRQSSTPNIPRPSWIPVGESMESRTFGVILDTSGSMDRILLAKSLGTIASYCMAREVPKVRVIFCDAACYDQGYMLPEEIAGTVKVKGRGGTILQPGIDLLETDENFPKKGPILVITDGGCDQIKIRREHAFVIPYGTHLPFVPRGRVFYIR